MKAYASVLMLLALATAGPAYATAIICYESDPCHHVTYEDFITAEDERFIPSQDDLYNGLPTPFGVWTVPAFDFSLGVPEVLLIDVAADVLYTARLHSLNGATEVNFSAILSTLNLADGSGPNVIGGGFASCTTAPCDFSFSGFVSDSTFVLPLPDKSGWQTPWWSDPDPLAMPIPFWSPDTFFRFTDANGQLISAPITIRAEVSGTAHATYLYEPFAVPEPTTVVLVGSGIAAAVARRRKSRASRRRT